MKSKNKIIIISAIALVVIVAVFAGLYFATDMFKTPRQLFFKYAGKQLESETSMSYNEMLEQLKDNKEKSYTANTDIKLNVESEDSDDQEMYDAINKLNLNLEQSEKPEEKKSYNKLNIGYDDKELGTVELVQDNERYALKSDYMLDEKYVAIENKNLKEFLRNMGADEEDIEKIPDQITMLDLYELLYISKKDQKSISKTYKKFIDENLPNEKFEVNKNVEISINGENKKTTEYKLTLNEKEMTEIAINFMNTLAQDEVTLNIIVDKYNKYFENTFAGTALYSNKSLDTYSEDESMTMTKEKLIDYIEEALKELEDVKEDMKEVESTPVISVSVYQAKGKLYRTQIKSSDKDTITIDNYEKDGRNYMEITVPVEEYSSKYISSRYSRGMDKVENKIIIDYVLNKQNKEVNVEGNIKIEKNSEEEGNMKFNITKKGKLGKGTNEIIMELASIVKGVTVKADVNSKIEYKNDVNTVDLYNNDNMIVLNEMSKEEITKLFKEVSQTLQKKLAETIEELGIGQQNSKLYDDEETDSDIDWNLNDETSLKDDLDWTSDSSEDDLDWTSDLSEDEES